MKTNTLFIILSVFIIFGCKQTSNTNDKPISKSEQIKESENIKFNNNLENNPKQKEITQTTETTEPATIKHGIKFFLPTTWKEKVKEFKSTNLKGNITSIQTDYSDIDDQSTINMVFYPGERGQQLFDYKSKNLDNSAKAITIKGMNAILKTEFLKTDGKGHQLDTPTKRIIVSLLTDKGEMNFIISSNGQISENTFNIFISKLEILTK